MITVRAASRFGFLEMVRGQQQRHAGGREIREHVVDAIAALRIHADRRLVEQHDARAMENAAGDVQPAPHATGELFDRLVRAIGEAGALERPVHLPARGPRLTDRAARRRPDRFSRAVSSG